MKRQAEHERCAAYPLTPRLRPLPAHAVGARPGPASALLALLLMLPAGAWAQPANDGCTTATVIPGNSVQYNPPTLNVSTALTNLCSPAHSCTGGSVAKDVFYVYTPDLDGTITVDTFGSNYNTILSAFAGCRGFCGGLSCCPNPIEYACNDNYFFGTQSQITFDVQAQESYIFRVSAINASGGEMLDFNLSWKPANDACANATPINGLVYSSPVYSTVNADVDTCEAQESCELNGVGTSNSVWYSYTAACDGLLTLDTEGSDYDTVLSVFDGCAIFYGVDIPCGNPAEIACDDDSGTGTLSRIADLPVTGGTEYLIKVADYNPALNGGQLQFNLRFDGADPPVAEITSPLSYDCACGVTPVYGTADQPAGLFAGYVLDYMPVGGTSRTLVATGAAPVNDGLLANWDTSSLPEGTYLLRLSVTNGCGVSSTAVQLVYVDAAFASLLLAGPANTVVGGKVCPTGTAWDVCFQQYTVDYAPSGSASFLPVQAATPAYFAAVTNDPLLPNEPWDTVADAIPDGDYDLRLTGVTTCGLTAQQTTVITVDNRQPVALIDSPL
ncbi:MAG TPA: hypothetical protein P5572_20530, partial [Phycisphaerae bacterium]|nr:hypothetical protein [Phycisphaerae bacterium]